MDGKKIIRSVCYFASNPNESTVAKLERARDLLSAKGYEIQTMRLCTDVASLNQIRDTEKNDGILLSVGSVPFEDIEGRKEDLFHAPGPSFNLDLTDVLINDEYIGLLFDLIDTKPEKTFDFAYVFNNPASSPFFPSANYGKEGFAVGLQSTDLAEGCESMEEWLDRMVAVWDEICLIFKSEEDFLGIDSSVAPLFQGTSSLVNLVKRFHASFNQSVLKDTYLNITRFIKERNPKPVGLCGLMFPCLEDFELADEYEQGNFSLERNLFLSLHSGLGIDTYPIGIDESPEKVVDILKVVQGLSNKYRKPLSVRFVSDGKAKIGEKTDLKNQYLKDVVIRPLM